MELGPLIPIVGILMGCGIPMVAIWSKHKTKIAQIQIGTTAAATAEKAAQYANQVQALEDRVRVLERIVTDSGYNVATQIEALRDQRRVDEADAGVPLGIGRKENV